MDEQANAHRTHTAIVKRLKRADGHLRGIVEMIEAGRPCLDIAQQLHAVEKAIAQAKKTLIHDHLNHCLDEAMLSGASGARNSIGEFKEIAKYL